MFTPRPPNECVTLEDNESDVHPSGIVPLDEGSEDTSCMEVNVKSGSLLSFWYRREVVLC